MSYETDANDLAHGKGHRKGHAKGLVKVLPKGLPMGHAKGHLRNLRAHHVEIPFNQASKSAGTPTMTCATPFLSR